jgi:single-stranded DNA-specific DHH superfamily exonuclease
VGRGTNNISASARPLPRQRQTPALEGGARLEQLFEQMNQETEIEPDWRVPNAFYLEEAAQFVRAGQEYNGLQLDPAVAVRLLKLEYGGDFMGYRRWFEGDRNLIEPPGTTCPGMNEAGQTLAKSLDKGHKIAVYCDYDVDGTTAGEVFRLGLEPYGADLHYGYADAQQGFGLTSDFVHEAKQAGAKVLVTLDCGTSQSEQVQLAKDLGMTVIVVDHHHIDPNNPATHHLNPKLYDPASSDNTGSQLAWKLAASVQLAKESQTRPELWERPMHLAGMGCLADMGSVVLPENRAFFWSAADHPAPGVVALAQALGEDPTVPGSMISTQACLNLPKRTPKVSAADVGALLAAPDAEAAAPLVAQLTEAYESAKPVRKAMVAEALLQTGEAIRHDDGSVDRPFPDQPIAIARIDDHSEYSGYSGPVASNVSRTTGKPAIVFVRKADGTYKFSGRNEARAGCQLGELIDDAEMQAACTIERFDESGQLVARPAVGGHPEVISGSCTAENVERVAEIFNTWGAAKVKKGGFWPKPWDGPEAMLSERKVSPERLTAIEQQAARLGPFSRQQQIALPSKESGSPARKTSNTELQISVNGRLGRLRPDPDDETGRWLVGQLHLEDGSSREVHYPADTEVPVGEDCEWVIRVGRPGGYWLRTFHRPTKRSAA